MPEVIKIDPRGVRPAGAQVWIDCAWYKVGVHNRAYVWVNGCWRKGAKTAAVVWGAMERTAEQNAMMPNSVRGKRYG